MQGAARYRAVLGAPHARGLLLAELPARLPIGINGIAIVLFARAHVGSYATAGLIAACFGAANGLSSPLIGRVIDRRGIRGVVAPLAVAHAAVMVTFVMLGLQDGAAWTLALLAAFAGALFPPLGSISRTLWPRILRDVDGGLLATALALEGVLVELVFVVGPLVVAACAAFGQPEIALLLSPALLLAGLGLLLLQPPVRAWEVSAQAGAHGVLGALRSPGIRTLVLSTMPMGFCFGAVEVVMPAFAEDHGSRALGGVLLAVWSAGSASGGLLYGARAWGSPLGARYARLACLLPLGYVPLAFAPSIAVMVPLALLAGLCIAPTLTAGNQLAGTVAPPGAETEAYTWPITSLVVGLALGNVVAGLVEGAADWRAGAFVTAGAALLAAVIAVTRRHTLEVAGVARPVATP